MADLLLEVGTEELPPGDIGPAIAQLGDSIVKALEELRLDAGPVATYATPRRLSVYVKNVADRQRPAERRLRGPAMNVAYDAEQRPTEALRRFAQSKRVPVESLEQEEAGGRRYVVAVFKEEGNAAADVLSGRIVSAITNLTFTKTMRWGSGDAKFARPIRWLVALFGTQVLQVEVAGVRAGRMTYGHRALASGPRVIRRPNEYVATLRAAKVIVDPAERRKIIEQQAHELAGQVEGRVLLDPRLLEETAMSVEYPYALRGTFDRAFLSLPREVLVTVMQHHQKYFPVEDAQARLLPVFIAVRDGGATHAGTVRQGHEWVLAARLADAKFFFQEDRKKQLEDYVPMLDGLVFQAQLGTMGDKTSRLVALSKVLSSLVLLDGRTAESLERAALLCKADLVTRLVGEFPELQGTIGQIYAALDGEATDVARAIGEHYRPRDAGDSLPRSHLGALLAFLDRVDTLVGYASIGLLPKGSEDPFGLRRTAQGIVGISEEHELPILVSSLGPTVLAHYGRDETGLTTMMDFLRQRVRVQAISRGIRHDVADAAIAASGDDLLGALKRGRALQDSLRDLSLGILKFTYDRVSRIHIAEAQAKRDIDPELFEDQAEKRLYEVVTGLKEPVRKAVRKGDFRTALALLEELIDPVDRFFDEVLVMTEDAALRNNRQVLLAQIIELFQSVADFSKIIRKPTSEALFEKYLRERQLQAEYEPVVKNSRPDYLVKTNAGPFIVEVKEFGEGDLDKTVQDAMRRTGAWAGAIDPYKRIREKITDAEKQLRGVEGIPSVVILYNPGFFVDLEDRIVQGAMFGDLVFRIRIDPSGETPPGEPRTAFSPTHAKLRPEQNTTISAVAVLKQDRPFKYIEDRESQARRLTRQAPEPEKGRGLLSPTMEQIEDTIEWRKDLSRRHPEVDMRALRLRVFHNTFARTPLHVSSFSGPYDIHFGARPDGTYGWIAGWKDEPEDP